MKEDVERPDELVDITRLNFTQIKSLDNGTISIGGLAKNTDTANIETKGYCWYKTTNGIKRHLLVDVLGNPYFVKCTFAKC